MTVEHKHEDKSCWACRQRVNERMRESIFVSKNEHPKKSGWSVNPFCNSLGVFRAPYSTGPLTTKKISTLVKKMFQSTRTIILIKHYFALSLQEPQLANYKLLFASIQLGGLDLIFLMFVCLFSMPLRIIHYLPT